MRLRGLRKKKSQQRRNYKYAIKKTEDEQKIKDLNSKIEKSQNDSAEITKELKKLDNSLVTVAEKFGRTYLDKINEYLKLFNPNIQLTKLNKKGSRFVYYIKIKEFDVRSDSESISLRHTLSEGDKSSLALAFFLARLKIQENLDKKTIIFDDPISSFDSSRRSVTINQLVSLSKRCKQFILLSHDINFVKDFISRSENCKSLKIVYKNSTSAIIPHNIELETMTGIYKDLTVMHNFLEKGETSEFDKREVVRCIRPSVEGMFRLKYFTIFKSDDWLGDMLKSIRESEQNEPLNKLQPILDDLSDINDYSKSYHHSNPNYLEIPLNSEELRNYVNRTIDLIQKI
ncbi:AAA family ATPase [Algoriphagus halophytocola]|uniref:AAA family ATPase n=1 Tax=Algoriphagus halophytocola TaxID=2991499 RepID=A0ABY6MPL2_9BACT|nr:AAA family ATPase [Algoriphagus sp. TR-M5]UZD24736.1 AAA family ATPase [Algoriphagus sp. TR-M5]